VRQVQFTWYVFTPTVCNVANAIAGPYAHRKQVVSMQDRSHPKSCAPKRMQSSSNRSVYGRSARSMASIDPAVEAQAMPLGVRVDHSIKHPTDDHAAQMHTSSSHVSSDPTPAHQQHFTMRQSFAKIVRENQGLVEEQEPNLDAWMHDPGAWGRRAPKADAVMIQPSTDAESSESYLRNVPFLRPHLFNLQRKYRNFSPEKQ
jgi:hypothetical protein